MRDQVQPLDRKTMIFYRGPSLARLTTVAAGGTAARSRAVWYVLSIAIYHVRAQPSIIHPAIPEGVCTHETGSLIGHAVPL